MLTKAFIKWSVPGFAVLALTLGPAGVRAQDYSEESIRSALAPRFRVKGLESAPRQVAKALEWRAKGIVEVDVERDPNLPKIDIPIEFETDESRIADWAQERLHNLARALASPELARCRFALNGHTDTTGTPVHNMDLSVRRALSVLDFLVRDGSSLGRDRFTVRGFGESSPIDQPARDEFKSQMNRRVEVQNLTPERVGQP